ncbi:Putative pH-response regulator protein palC [Septoria linicola]|uniref:pH-response regulator protein palC n=1 Tax=Septoria linicola TaxID=215465 RepID=A0A9Q9EEB5_9PEZI|nr:putative pH-response regulator protein palC [Septoria linicola]USW48616.1 Putative pH-response regulator protein palC [Septoria linicola]
MPFPYTLPTTSSVLLSDFFDSVTHPSLPLAATTKRSVLKDVLKKHKRLSPQARTTNLTAVQNAVKDYVPYLLALNAGSGYRDLGPEKLDVEIKQPLQVEWRSTLSATLPGRENARPKLTGLHHEIAFTLSTLAYTHTLLARSSLQALYGTTVLTSDQRTSAIATAMKHLMEAHSIHTYLLSLPTISAAAQDSPIDIQPSTISALASLALAEATIIVVSKDDPYMTAVADDRNASNTDWMFKAPTIPKVRAHLYARFCLAAAEHATAACGLLSRSGSSNISLTNPSTNISDSLTKYATDLRRTARAKAARFLAIDAELSGKTGQALAYLHGALTELSLSTSTSSSSDSKRKGLTGLKQTFLERREDRKAASPSGSSTWGMDAGRFEEARVIEMLEAKWDKENSTINVQLVPPFEPLIANMPSGREYHTPQPWLPLTLEMDVLVQMRAPPEPEERAFRGEEDDSGDEGHGGVYGQQQHVQPVGAFPGTASEYGRSATSNSYY